MSIGQVFTGIGLSMDLLGASIILTGVLETKKSWIEKQRAWYAFMGSPPTQGETNDERLVRAYTHDPSGEAFVKASRRTKLGMAFLCLGFIGQFVGMLLT